MSSGEPHAEDNSAGRENKGYARAEPVAAEGIHRRDTENAEEELTRLCVRAPLLFADSSDVPHAKREMAGPSAL